jgi:hypothetical protein
MTSAHQCLAVCSSASIHEVALLRQQLSLKDALLREIRDAKDAKDAVIASKEAVIAELQASKAATSSKAAQLESPELGTGAAPSAERLAATEVRLQRLEAALSTSSSSTSCEGSSSSSSSGVVLLIHQQKRARCLLHPAKPLEKDEVLDEIFSFVGRKEWLYVGRACRRWRGRYLSMCYKARASNNEHAFQTSHNSTFITAARFSMALKDGLKMPNESQAAAMFFDDFPRFSQQPIEVLTLARVHGAAWHKDICNDAAYYGDLELLKWLHMSGCPWDAPLVANNALRGKRRQYELILSWLVNIIEWSQQDKHAVLLEAGLMSDIATVEMLLQHGAEWPSSYVGEHRLNGETMRTCWHFRSVAWALSRGCNWGAWRCQKFAPQLYVDEEDRAVAVNLFEWAHKNGCPCTCEAAAAADTAVVA